MRKFLLYFLLILLIIAVGTFSYGILNAKKIQNYAFQITEIHSRHDLAPKIQKAAASFQNAGKKEMTEFSADSTNFSGELEAIIQEADRAKNEIVAVSMPGAASSLRDSENGYYSLIIKEASDLKGIFDYTNQIIGVAAIFGKINDNSTLEEMKTIIGEAKEKGNSLETAKLPHDLESDAQNLGDSMKKFIEQMEQTILLKSDNMTDLDASYNDFSQKEEIFFSRAKKFINIMEDIGTTQAKIKSETEKLGRIRFSLK